MIDSVQEILLARSRPIMAATTELDLVPERLSILREAAGFATDRAFAAHLDVSPQRLGNVMKGTGLAASLALLMCQKVPGLTTDWLYRGKLEGLSVDLARRIGAVEAARKGKTPSRSPKGGR